MKRADQVAVKKQRRGWAVVAATVVALIGVAFWLWPTPGPTTTGAGTPRVAVDRTEIDLGRLPFDRQALATFTLTNLGDGPLTLEGSPPVRAVQGC